MRVAQVIDKLTAGGAQTLLVTFAEQARRRGTDVTVIVLWANPRQFLVQRLESAGARVVVLPGRRLFNVKRFLKMLRFFRSAQFDVIHTHLFHADILGAVVGRMTNTPVISSLHNIATPPGKLRAFVWRSAVRHFCTCVIAVGQSVATAHEKWLGSLPCKVLSNPVQPVAGCSIEQRRELKQSLLGAADSRLILAVGMVAPQKAYQDLVAACAPICVPGSGNFLAIAGDGQPHHMAHLREVIEQSGAQVLALGVREDVALLLGAADVFVMSSHWEGLPVALLEAMSAGRAVVATSVGEVTNVLSDGAGILVPPGDIEQLREAIRGMLDDAGRRQHYGETARRRVAEQHDPAVWFDSQLKLYAAATAAPTI
ncbi:MAG: glycosyltransferase [Gammaproteobacteria bacterium]|nr:glycosyltransferase [Gammaproteobacteria bacterium]